MNVTRPLTRLALLPVILVAACSDPRLSTRTPAVTALGSAPVLPIGAGNALTLPAARHLVRIGGTLLLALQQDGADGHRLGLFRSDDDGGTFQRVAAIQDDPTHRDTADMLLVGNDIALVYSYEGPELAGSTAHDVWFQWWRQRGGSWSPDPAVRVFDSTSDSTGYYRAELAIDSNGRIWVQGFFLERDGSATAAVSVSSDAGAHFANQTLLAKLPFRGGGRMTVTTPLNRRTSACATIRHRSAPGARRSSPSTRASTTARRSARWPTATAACTWSIRTRTRPSGIAASTARALAPASSSRT